MLCNFRQEAGEHVRPGRVLGRNFFIVRLDRMKGDTVRVLEISIRSVKCKEGSVLATWTGCALAI